MKFVKLFIAASVVLLAIACNKSSTSTCTNATVESEATVISSYASSQGIVGTKDPSGVYYQIINEGGANKPTLTSKIYIKYRGEKLDGTVFDQATNPGTTGFTLNSLIEGWKIGIPKIGKGGKIKLVIPSALAYGCTGTTSSDSAKSIPANSPLFFEIEMEDFIK